MSRDKKWETPRDYRFIETEYLCRPVDDVHDLWYKWHYLYGVPWSEESRGHMEKIGVIEGRPVCVTVWWAHVAMKRVAFVEGTSQLVDHQMLEDWCSAVFPNVKASANQLNFHNIIGPIADALGVESLVARDPFAIEKVVQGLPNVPSYMRPRKKKS